MDMATRNGSQRRYYTYSCASYGRVYSQFLSGKIFNPSRITITIFEACLRRKSVGSQTFVTYFPCVTKDKTRLLLNRTIFALDRLPHFV